MNTYQWYAELVKPEWAPPGWLFGPVWTVLYVIIAITFSYVIYKSFHGEIPKLIGILFAANLVCNVIFSPIQFGLQNNLLATVDIILVLGTLTAGLILVYPYYPLVAIANIPYVLWVSFATVLQITITYLNW